MDNALVIRMFIESIDRVGKMRLFLVSSAFCHCNGMSALSATMISSFQSP
jgi:hypothetical protein